MIASSMPARRTYWDPKMTSLKAITVLLGAGLLLSLSLSFSTFGTEEAFVLLAALFA
jgi:hypothetical protein